VLFTASTAFAQASNKSEEVSRETKQEIQSILSDIQKRGPSPVVEPPALVVQAPAVPAAPVESRIAWQMWAAFSMVLVVFGALELMVFKSAMSRPFKLVIGGWLLLIVAGFLSVGSPDSSRHSSPASSGPPSSAETIAPLGFRFSVGDQLANVNNGVEIGLVVRTEMAHTFRNRGVGRAYIIARPDGTEMDMNADVLERIAAKR